MNSFSYFAKNHEDKVFNLIYIDESHKYDDAIIDAIKGFDMLKVGVVMIFDYYLWRVYERINDNLASAVNTFLILKNSFYKIIYINRQLAIEKISDLQKFLNIAC